MLKYREAVNSITNILLCYINTFAKHKIIFLSNSLGVIFLYFRNVLSTSCTTIPLLESPTRETLMSMDMRNATDGILSLTAMNALVPCRSSQSFTITGVEGFLVISIISFLKVIVKTSHEALSTLNSG